MTSGRLGSGGDFADALFGADGTGDPAIVTEAPVVFGDPLAEAPLGRTAGSGFTGSLTAPDAITRVDGPPPLTNDAIVAAGRQLAAEQAQQRSSTEARQRAADQARRTSLTQGRVTAQRRAAEQTALRSSQHSQLADPYRGRTSAQLASSNAPAQRPFAEPPVPPGAGPYRPQVPGLLTRADRAALLQQMKTATPQERRQLMGQLAAAQGKSVGKRGWGCLFGLILLILLGTGLGREIVQSIVDAINSGQ
ncbi:hypothetical protein [Nakamurella lactea]|uniref:hypothetical protein n=1 Tax=Nakamurella lactea TaxID=459515 RepID=UPI00041CEFFF|nr:hypothetical protein [Nakamurella lactea]